MEAKNILTKRNIRSTPFREEVISVFFKYPQAINLEIIEGHLGKFDRITLYRTLKTFEESGVIHEIALVGDDKYWALCSEDCQEHEHEHEHIHFHCKKCQEIFCVPVDQLPTLKLPGFVIDHLDIHAKGYCSKCRA